MRQRLRVDPADLGVDAVGPGGVAERLGDGQVRVRQLDVLADEGDLEARLRGLDPLDERAPRVEVRLDIGIAETELADDEPAEAGRLEHERHFVDRLGRLGRDDGLDVDVGEEGDLLADLVADRMVGAQDDDVRLDTDPAELLDRVLGRLRLELAGRRERRQQRHVDVEDVRPPDVLAHLADRLEERQALDVADGPADLDDHDVRIAVPGDPPDPLLDLVRDVGNDLDGAAEVVAAALLGDDRLVDAAGRDVAELGQVLVDEPLVVAQVEVRLGAVVGDEDLAVLVGRHRPRVDVDVGVELEDRDVETAGLEQPADAGGGDAFAERGGHASGHKDILRHGSGPPGVFRMLSKSPTAATRGPWQHEAAPGDRAPLFTASVDYLNLSDSMIGIASAMRASKLVASRATRPTSDDVAVAQVEQDDPHLVGLPQARLLQAGARHVPAGFREQHEDAVRDFGAVPRPRRRDRDVDHLAGVAVDRDRLWGAGRDQPRMLGDVGDQFIDRPARVRLDLRLHVSSWSADAGSRKELDEVLRRRPLASDATA